MKSIIRYIDCHGDYPTLSAQKSFRIKIDKDHESAFFVSMGLDNIELIMSGRFRAKKIGDLIKYQNLQHYHSN